jgi:hypothetical protein
VLVAMWGEASSVSLHLSVLDFHFCGVDFKLEKAMLEMHSTVGPKHHPFNAVNCHKRPNCPRVQYECVDFLIGTDEGCYAVETIAQFIQTSSRDPHEAINYNPMCGLCVKSETSL